MSYEYGMAAINLEMTDHVPRSELSAESHWDLVKKVTGIDVSSDSPEEVRSNASRAFKNAWDYDFSWRTFFHRQYFGENYTRMGHAVYAQNGVDFDTKIINFFNEPEEIYDFDPFEVYGELNKKELIQAFNDDYDLMCEDHPDGVNMTGIYSTAMSGMIEVCGWDMLLMAAGIDPKAYGEAQDRYCSWVMTAFEALAECKAPVVMIHDDIVWTQGAFLHPDWYRKYIFPNYKKMFAPVVESGKKVMYTSDGDYSEFIDDVASCNINGFVTEPMTDMEYIANKYGKTHSFMGNVDTGVLLLGTKEDIFKHVEEKMNVGKHCPGFFMSVGNHIPPNTPVDNCLYYNEAYEKFGKR